MGYVKVLKCIRRAIAFFCLIGSIGHLTNADVTGIRFGQNGDTTRVVLDMTVKVDPGIFLLAAPNRVVIDLPANDWRASDNVKTPGLIDGYRHGLFNTGTYRIVLDLNGPATVKSSFYIPPKSGYSHRLVLDLQISSQAKFLGAVKESKEKRRKLIASSNNVVSNIPAVVKPRSNNKRLIVIDPGHGGVDPGTLGVLGVNENVIVLKIAKVIKQTLEASGRYDVRLTRSTNVYIPHRQRYGIAKRLNADFFVSIHADAIANSKVRGGTIYTLSEKASDREAARLAAKENRSDIIAGLDLASANDDVSNILIDLAQRETMNLSAQFAETLLPEMRNQVKMLKRGHRYANLLVLKSPDIPSILLETGYLTNKEDARLLNSRDGQRRIALALRNGLDKYFQEQSTLGR
jgi:N-acetylmuramoyl-L-alanine amidase